MLAAKIAKTERIEARIRPEQKDTFQRAADLLGVSLTDFLIESAQARANDVIQEHTRILLSDRDSQTFVDALLEPPSPNQSLKDAAQSHKTFVKG